jgi:hypothetical protein
MERAGYVLDMDGASLGASGPSAAMDHAYRTRADGTVASRKMDTPTAEIPLDEKSLLGSQPEIDIAVADFDCRVETNYVARYLELRIGREQAFVDSHRSELDKMVAAATEAGW